MYSLSGKEILVSWKKNSDGSWHIMFSAAAGTYLVSVESAGKRFTQRILLIPD
jgi:hypothetical protein